MYDLSIVSCTNIEKVTKNFKVAQFAASNRAYENRVYANVGDVKTNIDHNRGERGYNACNENFDFKGLWGQSESE